MEIDEKRNVKVDLSYDSCRRNSIAQRERQNRQLVGTLADQIALRLLDAHGRVEGTKVLAFHDSHAESSIR